MLAERLNIRQRFIYKEDYYPMYILETERLYLRELTINDAENFYLLNEDKDVLKYTGDKRFKNIEEAAEFLKNYDQYKKYGFGRWAVISKHNNAFLGWCGLKFSPELNETDIGFRFFKKYWNKGYASEAAKACLKIGSEKFNQKSIIGRAMKQNKPSVRVLEKLGLVFHKSFSFDGQEGVIYKTP